MPRRHPARVFPRLPVSSTSLATTALLALSVAGALVACSLPGDSGQEIGVYSGRHYNTDKQLYERFTEKTGIRVKLLEGKDNALIERLRSEGEDSPADVLVLADAARLAKAASMDLFQPTRSATLEQEVPANLRDDQGRWFGLTRRVRVVVVNPKQVDPAAVGTYADLAGPALKGKLCLRNSRSVYNQSLVADQMILRGEEATTDWVKGMVANLGQPFFTSDTPLARAVARGECGAGLVNSYYVARMLSGTSGEEDRTMAGTLKVVFPDPAHVNITGAGVTRHSDQAEQAIRLIEFLASPSGGKGYAEANNEYPLKGFGDSPVLSALGGFRSDGVSAARLGEINKEAVALMQDNGWQ